MTLSPELFIAIASVVGTLLTGVATYLATRSNIRNSLRQLNIEEKKVDVNLSVEAAEKLGALSLAMTTNAQKELMDCVGARDKYRIESEAYRLSGANVKVRLNALIIRLQDMYQEHETLVERNRNRDCPGYPILQQMILDSIEEIKKEVRNGTSP